MSVVFCNNKCHGRGALVKNAKRCLNQRKNNIDEAPLLDLLVRNPLSRGEFLDVNCDCDCEQSTVSPMRVDYMKQLKMACSFYNISKGLKKCVVSQISQF